MNNAVEPIHLPQTDAQLVEQYEKLRVVALDTSIDNREQQSGLSILSFRGMACWIQALCSATVPINFCQPLQQTIPQTLENVSLPSVHKEVTAILTNMVLLHHTALRSNYA